MMFGVIIASGIVKFLRFENTYTRVSQKTLVFREWDRVVDLRALHALALSEMRVSPCTRTLPMYLRAHSSKCLGHAFRIK